MKYGCLNDRKLNEAKMNLRRLTIGAMLSLTVMGTTGQVYGAEHGTAQEAVAMVKNAVKAIKTNGRDKALAEFNNPAGPFIDRDMYITVTSLDGVALAHGGNQKLIGKRLLELKDVDGKTFIKSFLDVATTKGSGWVEYKWPDPLTKSIRQKSSYVEKVDDMVVTCGVYQ